MGLKKRRATSPVLAEVILIAVAIIIAIPLGGFVFGTAASYAKTADVSINFVNCAVGDQTNSTICLLNLNNEGSVNAELKPSSYLLIFYGHSTSSTYSDNCYGQSGNLVPPGSSLIVQCTFNIPPGLSGARFTGWVALVTGQNLPFAGTFS